MEPKGKEAEAFPQVIPIAASRPAMSASTIRLIEAAGSRSGSSRSKGEEKPEDSVVGIIFVFGLQMI